ncbi:MAG: hypothetical protein WAM11_04585 [Cyanobium sp.]
MFSLLLQESRFRSGLALKSTIPAMMAAAMVGGGGLLLSAGSAQALDTCFFGGAIGPSGYTACSTGLVLTTGDKNVKLTTLPTVGSGQIDFANLVGDLFTVRTFFTPVLNAQFSNAKFQYDIDIISGTQKFAGIKLAVNAVQAVDVSKADATPGGPYFETLFSADSLSPIPSGLGFYAVSGDRTSLSVLDTYTVGPTSSLTSFTNTFQQTEVPGPLPLVGAGMAFGFSRKLRNRIKTSARAKA